MIVSNDHFGCQNTKKENKQKEKEKKKLKSQSFVWVV